MSAEPLFLLSSWLNDGCLLNEQLSLNKLETLVNDTIIDISICSFISDTKVD
jgi:hypothetical protein